MSDARAPKDTRSADPALCRMTPAASPWVLIFQGCLALATVVGAIVTWRKLHVDLNVAMTNETDVWLQDNARLRKAVEERDARIVELEHANLKLEAQHLSMQAEIDGLKANVIWLRDEAEHWRKRAREDP